MFTLVPETHKPLLTEAKPRAISAKVFGTFMSELSFHFERRSWDLQWFWLLLLDSGGSWAAEIKVLTAFLG